MESTIRLGRIWGIPVGLHASWFLIFGLVTFSLAVGYFPEEYPDFAPPAYWLLGALTSLLFFASVLVHELAHAFVALRNKIPVRAITLFIFGGVAQIEQEPRTAGAEFRIAIAGPLASLALAGGFGLLYLLDRNISSYLAAPSLWLARINFLLVLFNMIPGFPLDGGRVLRAGIWQVTGSFRRATRLATQVGQLVAFGFMGFGAFATFSGSLFNGLWLIFIGWFLQNAATSTYRQMGVQEALSGIYVGEVMTRNCTYVPRQLSVKELVEKQIISGQQNRCFFVGEGGETHGVLTIDRVTAVSRDEWDHVTTGDLMDPWRRTAHVEPATELLTALRLMDSQQVGQMPVIERGRMVGVLSRDEVVRYLRLRAEVSV